MSQTDFSRTVSYARALPVGRGPVKGGAAQRSTLDGVAGGKIIARVKPFGDRLAPLFFSKVVSNRCHIPG
jgi:hypothetical protein